MNECKKCKIVKSLTEFHHRNDTKKHRTVCKDCLKKQQAARPKKQAKKKQSAKGAIQKWNEYIAINNHLTRCCSGCMRVLPLSMYHAKNLMRCRDCISEQRKVFRENNKEKLKKEGDNWREENREYLRDKTKEYRSSNKDAIRERNRIYMAKQRKINPQYRLRSAMGGALNVCLKLRNLSKCRASWQEILGYTAEELARHLEAKFTPEMTWENYGSYWHIDHVVPQSWFKYESTDSEEFKVCWALTNLQPLEAGENMRKQNKWAG